MRIFFVNKKIEQFILGLEKNVSARAFRAFSLLEHFGNDLRMPHSKKLIGKLFELRVRGEIEVRIFYTFKNNKAYILHGFIKKSSKIPKKKYRLLCQY